MLKSDFELVDPDQMHKHTSGSVLHLYVITVEMLTSVSLECARFSPAKCEITSSVLITKNEEINECPFFPECTA